MRRAQSVRNYARPSLALGADDLGVLREGDESTEGILRRQLLEKDRENDKLRTHIQTLQAQLAQRPPLETVQALEKEYTNLEILLQGTQRENERCMAELERTRVMTIHQTRGKTREKMLERELEKLAGANWQANLDIAPQTSTFAARTSALLNNSKAPSPHSTVPPVPGTTVEATMAHIEKIRLMIIGMEQRLQTREEKLSKNVERAEAESTRFEEMRRQLVAAPT